MRSALARLAPLLAAALVFRCAPAPRVPSVELSGAQALSRIAARAPRTLEARGRAGVRTPEGASTSGFHLVYDEVRGARLEIAWKSLAGLVRRDATLVVRGDSLWLAGQGGSGADDLVASLVGPLLDAGLAPGDLADLLVGSGDLEGWDARAARRRRDGALVLSRRGRGRAETLTVDPRTGDLLERSLAWPGSGRRLQVLYGEYARVGRERRPASIEIRDSEGPTRIRFVLSEQTVGVPVRPGALATPPGARLVVPEAPRPATSAPGGTFDMERGAW